MEPVRYRRRKPALNHLIRFVNPFVYIFKQQVGKKRESGSGNRILDINNTLSIIPGGKESKETVFCRVLNNRYSYREYPLQQHQHLYMKTDFFLLLDLIFPFDPNQYTDESNSHDDKHPSPSSGDIHIERIPVVQP